ncbi:MAG: pyridoxal phosphate-dependent aminotransferase [Melioribacteraceae bacterium]|nr:pyridoxal phosphate-dependent aminotransferase [Melioribacteraceae bacterium]MCF8354117.1 pyridoxal phosphate-dependent aminotransferase [Melioribacteraceae bacterium]MCF8393344.1 pyridoxal phosphate-dependent aminotransferase [Melioribacteraceae bacterium]MCF8418909.1 pyridoxal phosphate-dependent aminotransferase [Melioribacteraceae bacterium]
MRTKVSGATYSSIVGIGEQLKKKSLETGKEYLYLNRGVNAVVNIDLTEVIPLIDFNSNEIQVYPSNNGIESLRKAINHYYFMGNSSPGNIFITNGGMNALDLVTQCLDVDKIYVSRYYWGSYTKIMTINGVDYSDYKSFEELESKLDEIKNSAVIICDPNNPLGDKFDDEELLRLVALLNANGTVVIWDSPYRKLFYGSDDDFYAKLIDFENVIITDSFSKSIGLSGQRLGFMHSTNKEFNDEFNIHLLYATNGINAFAQVLVQKILSTPQGQKAAKEFQQKTVTDITKNIEYLHENSILADEYYRHSKPVGIFVIVNRTYDELLKYRIGSVALPFFTQSDKQRAESYSRICVSIKHEKFVEFFDRMLKG